ncbi:MAG: ABC transporter permease [Bifidobacteriaceae bacterium]|nr:ABC transporter permease [Bifidobacteriaceae bacterium]
MDEPTSGLDPTARDQVWKTINALRQDHGTTVFLTTHYLAETEDADEVMLLDHGRMVVHGTPQALRERFSTSILTVTPAPISSAADDVRHALAPWGGGAWVGGALRVELDSAATPRSLLSELGEAVPGASEADARPATTAWVMAAILMVTTLNASSVAISQLVDDRTNHHIDDFLVSPLRRRSIIGGAWLAVFIYSMIVVLGLAVACLLVLAVMGASLPSMGGMVTLFAALIASTAAFASLNVLLGTLLPSESAVGLTVALFSSVVGFLTGVYVPVGVLGTGMATVVFALPFGQSAYLIRDALARPAMETLGGSPQATDAIENIYGLDFVFNGTTCPSWVAWTGVIVLGTICFGWALTRVRSLGRR